MGEEQAGGGRPQARLRSAEAGNIRVQVQQAEGGEGQRVQSQGGPGAAGDRALLGQRGQDDRELGGAAGPEGRVERALQDLGAD